MGRLVQLVDQGHGVVLQRDVAVALGIGQQLVTTQAELARAQKLESIGLLAGGIAHDFNNILMAVFGSLSLAKLKSTPKDPVYTFVAKAEEQCLRARALTRKLLAYSSGGTLQRKTVLIADAIRDTADFALSGKNVKCRFSLPDGLWPAHIDEGQMRQVVHALVTNACEAMPGGGIVEIGAENIELADGQIQALKAYPYGCLEQTTSGLYPSLYADAATLKKLGVID